MWLLVGGDSEIGRTTAARARATGFAIAATTRRTGDTSSERPLLDLSMPLGDWAPPVGTEAACIFAAIARLAACENDPAGSARINVEGTLAVADRLLQRGVHVLFLSTNQVFDGAKPLTPADAPLSPQTEYGRQKARTETALRQRMSAGAPVAILRLAKVVSPDMKLFQDWIAAFRRGEPVTAFGDMMLAPTPTAVVADAIIALMRDKAAGTFQLTGPRDVTYANMARRIATAIGADAGLVREASATTVGLPLAALPKNTTLDASAIRQRYGFTAPDVAEIVAEVVAAAR